MLKHVVSVWIHGDKFLTNCKVARASIGCLSQERENYILSLFLVFLTGCA